MPETASFAERMAALGIVVSASALIMNPAWTVPANVAGVDAGGLSEPETASLALEENGGSFREIENLDLLTRSPLRTTGMEDVVTLAQAMLLVLERDGLSPASSFESAVLLVARRRNQENLPPAERVARDIVVISEEIRYGGRIWYPIFVDGQSVGCGLIPGTSIPAPYWMRVSVFATPK